MADPSAIPTQTDEQPLPSEKPQIRVPSLRSISDSPSMHASSKPLGPVDAARRGPIHTPFAAGGLSKDVQDRLKAFQASRSGAPPTGGNASSPGAHMRGVRPTGPNWISAPVIPGRQMPGMPKLSLADRRKIGFPGGLPGAGAPTTPGMTNNAPRPGGMKGRAPPGNLTSQGSLNGGIPNANGGSQFDQYSQYLDKETGALKFENKAVLHNRGVDFSSGSSFTMSRDELEVLEELGKGNYGTVYKVVHKSKAPLGRRQSVSREQPYVSSPDTPGSSGLPTPEDQDRPSLLKTIVPGTVMAMKEIRLELDENKFAQIIMELDVLHRCRSPYIIDFYGAFFSEGAVFICMEHMDGGSIDKLYGGGIPEGVLRKIALGTIIGLKTLKESHNIIHRDVKPTNILVNTRGDVKLCDFGVSGNLVASIAKTNIGCQSYMAPERISSGGAQAAMGGSSGPIGTYGVQSDVWSLGLSILECAMGCYPYPPETYNNIFSQLSAIVDGEPPNLPEEGFTPAAHNFVRGCLHKVPKLRPSYAMLLEHPWISDLIKPSTISEEDEEAEEIDFEAPRVATVGDVEVGEWVIGAMELRRVRIEEGIMGPVKPALHAAPLDTVPNPVSGLTDGVAALIT